jgi:hypothetical protein
MSVGEDAERAMTNLQYRTFLVKAVANKGFNAAKAFVRKHLIGLNDVVLSEEQYARYV